RLLRLLLLPTWHYFLWNSRPSLQVSTIKGKVQNTARAANLPVPRVWPDANDNLVTIAGGSGWAVVDEAPGRVNPSAMTVPLAEHIGVVMGRMHRALAAYPLPGRVQQTRWRAEPVEDAVAKCDTVMTRATRQGHDGLDQLRVDLDQRREDLRAHVHLLREHLPATLVEQALHADLSRTNLITLADAVTGVIDFRCANAMPAWELGRTAFDPRTVATSTEWGACALAMARAYRSEHPSLPMREVRACARIALLYMLFSFYGATTAEYDLPLSDRGAVERPGLSGNGPNQKTAPPGSLDGCRAVGIECG
ncbi:phosphotransferase enzyme family protein, partial [Streptomyces sp. NPDC057474]|uniref:phosphotransferase enzyme family protein n=1 Tax=Streptomyces sp. NPDC057474 TaxID=3346144 RepID=UPI0036917886